ncbi:hypothetical protein [Dactylosporangium fulvum]|uniref:Uncharacterized protein n=1 Tax=Dactylosporangium fulvum TaxID=53359 RepID=A0ABY5VRD5_9ACTN|nr:hypothetical protein [Dactylosporangium fulvum]UWP79760.1 hypothetical protein Dfulv_31955 [Dactylosporangium fulvum]
MSATWRSAARRPHPEGEWLGLALVTRTTARGFEASAMLAKIFLHSSCIDPSGRGHSVRPVAAIATALIGC